jgi:hypothetical protein
LARLAQIGTTMERCTGTGQGEAEWCFDHLQDFLSRPIHGSLTVSRAFAAGAGWAIGSHSQVGCATTANTSICGANVRPFREAARFALGSVAGMGFTGGKRKT